MNLTQTAPDQKTFYQKRRADASGSGELDYIYCTAYNGGNVTTYIVRLKLFRLKAEGVRKERLPHFGGETADFRIKHGFKVRSIPAFPNSLQPLAYPPE